MDYYYIETKDFQFIFTHHYKHADGTPINGVPRAYYSFENYVEVNRKPTVEELNTITAVVTWATKRKLTTDVTEAELTTITKIT